MRPGTSAGNFESPGTVIKEKEESSPAVVCSGFFVAFVAVITLTALTAVLAMMLAS